MLASYTLLASVKALPHVQPPNPQPQILKGGRWISFAALPSQVPAGNEHRLSIFPHSAVQLVACGQKCPPPTTLLSDVGTRDADVQISKASSLKL